MRRYVLAFYLTLIVLATPAQAQQYPPTYDWASILKTYFDDDSGLIQFTDYVVGFAPEGPFKGEVAVIDSSGKTLARFPFFPDRIAEDGVFARVRVQGPAELTLTTPGIYNMIFLVGGKPVTRVPFVLHEKKSGDAFKPGSTYEYDGVWRSLAFFTMVKNGDMTVPTLNFWVGGRDLPEGSRKDMYRLRLMKGGKEVAVSKKSLGSIAAGHFKLTTASLFHPHDERQQQNARFFTQKDLGNGAYELIVTRQSDGAAMRNFKFKVAGGQIENLPRATLGFQPAMDFIAPRVAKRNVTVFAMEEAIWMEDLD